jgi:hypothetical protein
MTGFAPVGSVPVGHPALSDALAVFGSLPAVYWTGQALPGSAFSASGGTAPYTFGATGLPTGWSINVTTGLVSGIATATGSFSVVVTVTDFVGATASTTAFPVDIYQLTTSVIRPRAQQFRVVFKKQLHHPFKGRWRDRKKVFLPNLAMARVTWSGLEVANPGNAYGRVTWTGLEVASPALPSYPFKRKRAPWTLKAKHRPPRRRRQFAAVLYQGPAQVTWSGVEVANSGDAYGRVTWSGVEVANSGDALGRVTWSGVEVANPGDAWARVTWTGIEVASPATRAVPTIFVAT